MSDSQKTQRLFCEIPWVETEAAMRDSIHDLVARVAMIEKKIGPVENVADFLRSLDNGINGMEHRVQALEARVDAIEGEREDDGRDEMRRLTDERDAALKCSAEWAAVCHEIGNILGSQTMEKYVDAARRVVAERDVALKRVSEWCLISDAIGDVLGSRRGEKYVDAARRVVAERNAAGMERDEAVRLLHRFAFAMYGHQVGVSPFGAVRSSFEFLGLHGLATDHGDGTYTLLEPKP